MTSKNTVSRNDWRDAVWNSDLAPNPRLVALVYADHANNDADTVWVTLARGLERTGIKHHVTWSKYVGELVAAGWLVEVETRTNQRAARYRLTIPDCHDVTPEHDRVSERDTPDRQDVTPRSVTQRHQTPTYPLPEPLLSPAADAAECHPAVTSHDADEWGEMDALEAQDPHCFAMALRHAMDTLGPYEVDLIATGHPDARHDHLNALTIAAYDHAHPWETAA